MTRTIGIFIDPCYKPKPRPAPVVPVPDAPPPPPTPAALSLGDLCRLIPEDGWNWALLSLLWDRREEPVGVWRLVNKLADGFNTTDRYHKRRVRMSIWDDLSKMIKQGWVVRHGGKIQLNLMRISAQSGL
jgi:hypothetical protein